MSMFEEFSSLPFIDGNQDEMTAHGGFEWRCPHCQVSLMGRGKARVVLVGAADLAFTEDGVTPEGAPGEWFGDGGFADAFAVCGKCGGRFRITDELPSSLSSLLGG